MLVMPRPDVNRISDRPTTRPSTNISTVLTGFTVDLPSTKTKSRHFSQKMMPHATAGDQETSRNSDIAVARNSVCPNSSILPIMSSLGRNEISNKVSSVPALSTGTELPSNLTGTHSSLPLTMPTNESLLDNEQSISKSTPEGNSSSVISPPNVDNSPRTINQVESPSSGNSQTSFLQTHHSSAPQSHPGISLSPRKDHSKSTNFISVANTEAKNIPNPNCGDEISLKSCRNNEQSCEVKTPTIDTTKDEADSSHKSNKHDTVRSNASLERRDRSSGRWSREEHEAFLAGLKIFGREWKKVAQRIPTRTSAQIRSHAQKYFSKLAREEQQQQQQRQAAISTPFLNGSSSSSVAPVGNLPNTISAGHKNLSSSVLEKVEKILKDPAAVQREVEDTLRRLRDRYRELQQRVEQQQQGGNFNSSSIQPLVEPYHQETRKPRTTSNSSASNYSPSQLLSNTLGSATAALNKQQYLESRKRPFGALQSPSNSNSVEEKHSKFSKQDLSRCHQHPISVIKTDLVNKELIALHVLGGALRQSGSSENLSRTSNNSSNSVNQLRNFPLEGAHEPVAAPVDAQINSSSTKDIDSEEEANGTVKVKKQHYGSE